MRHRDWARVPGALPASGDAEVGGDHLQEAHVSGGVGDSAPVLDGLPPHGLLARREGGFEVGDLPEVCATAVWAASATFARQFRPR